MEKYGGWLDRRIVDDFAYYARYIINEFKDKVKYWTTINEQSIIVQYWTQNAISRMRCCRITRSAIRLTIT